MSRASLKNGRTTDNPRSRMSYYQRGPGPAAYNMPPLLGRPNHDVRKPIMPSPPIGVKLPKEPVSLGPGPAYYTIEYGQKANGLYGYGLAYTMREKWRPRKYKVNCTK